MKKFLFFVLPVILVVMALNSCSSSDDGDGDSGNGVKLIKSIEVTYSYGSSELNEFVYDNQNRLVLVKYYDDAQQGDLYSYPLTYSTNAVTWNAEGAGTEDKFILDNGYITEYVFTSSIGTPSEYSRSQPFEYTDGHISKITYGSSVDFNYTWDDGNLVEIGKYGSTLSTTYTYNNKENKLNMYVGDIDTGFLTYVCPFKGFKSKNYVVRSVTESEDGTFTTFDYEYTYDSEDYPTQVVVTVTGDYSYSEIWVYKYTK